jgi:RNA-directed DNA polymerase
MNELTTTYEWSTLPWRKLERRVFKLQKRIYQASLRGDVKTVRRLQKLMMKSWSAKCLAVRRVTQDNQGKKTAGIDGLASLTPSARSTLVHQLKLGDKAAPSRRVWIPKPGSTEQRPLSIPVMYDRAMQALVKQALEPEWEAKFEKNSFGFRPGRSCHDAIEAIFLDIKQKAKYILETDVAKCFDQIDHKALCEKLNASPSTTRQIRAWLKAGVMDNGLFQATPTGAAQGSVISPLLANIALHGLEKALWRAFRGARRPTLVRYADDLVVIHPNLAVVERSQQVITKWLTHMGLELKPSKTRITHTLVPHEGRVGFDFLGFNIRQYPVGKTHSKKGFKTLIKPSREAQRRHSQRIGEVVKAYRAVPQAALIHRLNPILRGWANYFSTACSKETYSTMDHMVYQKLRAWAYRRHSNKNHHWITGKYWLVDSGEGWVFATRNEQGIMRLFNHTQTPVKRHVKVQGNRSPYDGDWIYWSRRLGRYPLTDSTVAKLLKKQTGQCAHCGLYFRSGDLMEVHHLDKDRNNYKQVNLALLHRHCHDQTHAMCV